jgi:hypothetical protein
MEEEEEKKKKKKEEEEGEEEEEEEGRRRSYSITCARSFGRNSEQTWFSRNSRDQTGSVSSNITRGN